MTFARSSLYAMSLIVLCFVFTATEILTAKVKEFIILYLSRAQNNF